MINSGSGPPDQASAWSDGSSGRCRGPHEGRWPERPGGDPRPTGSGSVP